MNIKLFLLKSYKKCKKIIDRTCKKVYVNIIKLLPYKTGVSDNKKNELIVSLTSYPQRFDTIHICIKSLLYQTKKPDKIILWLTSESKNVALPKELLKLVEFGLDIKYRDENLKPHNKYYYAFKEYPDSLIITVDDDAVYSPFLISSLLKIHQKYPNSVCARRVHLISFDGEKIESYNLWEQELVKIKKPSTKLFATGVGGVLYNSKILSKEVLNKENIMKHCLCADDIWLKYMETLEDIKVVWCPCIWRHPANIIKAHPGLCDINVDENRNDMYIKELSALYPDVIGKIKKD